MNIGEIEYTRARLKKAEAIADSLRHDGRLHELALEAVFAIEDRLFVLEETAAEAGHARRAAPARDATIIPFPSRAMARAG